MSNTFNTASKVNEICCKVTTTCNLLLFLFFCESLKFLVKRYPKTNINNRKRIKRINSHKKKKSRCTLNTHILTYMERSEEAITQLKRYHITACVCYMYNWMYTWKKILYMKFLINKRQSCNIFCALILRFV